MTRILSFLYGAVSYVFFLGVFLYAIGFVANVGVPKSIDSGARSPLAAAVAVDAILLGLFAVQHSGMARPGFKRWWTRIVPAPIERSTYVLVASGVLALLFWQWRPIPDPAWEVRSSGGALLLNALAATGWLLVLGATFMISHAHLFGLKQVHDHLRGRTPSPARFATPALYRYVRHPLLLGFLIAFWAAPVMSWGRLLFAIATTGYILIAVRLEERDLVGAFGERYRAYQKRVPMFVPRPGRRAETELAAAQESAAVPEG